MAFLPRERCPLHWPVPLLPSPTSGCLIGHITELRGHHAASSCPVSPARSSLPPPLSLFLTSPSLSLPLLSLSPCPCPCPCPSPRPPRILILLQLQQVPDPWMWHEELLGILVLVTGARERAVSGMQTADVLGNYGTGLMPMPRPTPLSLSRRNAHRRRRRSPGCLYVLFSLLGEHFRDFDPVFADAPVGLHAIRLQEGRIPWQVALPVPRSNERLAVATTAL